MQWQYFCHNQFMKGKKYVKYNLLLVGCDWRIKLWFDGIRLQFFGKITGKYRINRIYRYCSCRTFDDF